jgi:probable phosphoglycerate mutase
MSTVVLIRPGCTDYDEQSRLLGVLEMPMNKRGIEQVQESVRQIQQKGLQPEAIYASPADPAYSTAVAIAEALGNVKVKELDELRNVNQGLWQGLPESDVRKRYPKVFRVGREQPQSICPPEGETLADACQRMARVINKAIRKHDVFAIVAVEPIATVIRCTLQQRCPSVDACLCGEEETSAVESFDTSEFDSMAFVNAAQDSDDADTPEKQAAQESSVK